LEKLIVFDVEGDFAAFRDPSITTNQTVYCIPPKSAVIGFIGGIIGLNRGHTCNDEIYCPEFVQLLEATRIGIRFNSTPRKITFFTNHRSLKKIGVKPFKMELLCKPNYTFFVETGDDFAKRLWDALKNRRYTYTPYLGHAYCLARISEPHLTNAKEVDPEKKVVSTVVLDEKSETFATEPAVSLHPDADNSRLVIERHLYHYVEKGEIKRIVLRHLIPIEGSKFEINKIQKERRFTKFVKIEGMSDEEAICLF